MAFASDTDATIIQRFVACMEQGLSNPARVSASTVPIFSSDQLDTLNQAQLFGKLMVHVVNGDQLQSLLTVIKYLTKDIEDKEETFEVRDLTDGNCSTTLNSSQRMS